MLLKTFAEMLPLRPLLYAAGFSAVTVGMYYYFKHHSGENIPEERTVVPLWEHVTDPVLIQSLEVPQDQIIECEREQEDHSMLLTKYNEIKNALIYKEDLLKVSLMEAEQKHQKALKIISQLEAEKSLLQFECNKKIITLTDKEEVLKVSLAEVEEKYKQAVNTIAQLEANKCDLTQEVETLKERVRNMGDTLSETHRWWEDKVHECEREHNAHRTLQAEYDNMKKTLKDNEEILKFNISFHETMTAHVSLMQAEQKHQKALNWAGKSHLLSECNVSIVTLTDKDEVLKVSLAEPEEKYKQAAQVECDLTQDVEILRERMRNMGDVLSETLRQWEDKIQECERELNDHRNLQADNMKTKAEITKKHLHTTETMEGTSTAAERMGR